jgi:UDP-N-acetylglucosamine acyltransferase
MSEIHRTACIDPEAALGERVTVGACAVIEAGAVIGDDCAIGHHAVVCRGTTMGAGNHVYPTAVIGGPPQDLKFAGESTKLTIGARNVFREAVTVNRGTVQGAGVTVIGDDNFLMACSHVAHDCRLANGVIMSNGVLLAGHVLVEDKAYLCGLAAAHQFTTIGRNAYVGGMTRIVHDVPPFMITEGNPQKVRGVNLVGLRRAGFPEAIIEALTEAYRLIWRARLPYRTALGSVQEQVGTCAEVAHLVQFLKAMESGINGRAQEAHRLPPR